MLNIKKFVVGFLAALCMISALLPAALAAPAEDDGSWDKLIADFLDKYEDCNKSCSITLGYRNLVTGEELSADDRQNTFTNMMKIGLEIAVKMAAK